MQVACSSGTTGSCTSSHDLGGGFVVDESRRLDTLILVIPLALERLQFSHECMQHHLFCPVHPGSLEMTFRTLAAVMCDAEDPCSVNAAYEPESAK